MSISKKGGDLQVCFLLLAGENAFPYPSSQKPRKLPLKKKTQCLGYNVYFCMQYYNLYICSGYVSGVNYYMVCCTSNSYMISWFHIIIRFVIRIQRNLTNALSTYIYVYADDCSSYTRRPSQQEWRDAAEQSQSLLALLQND